MLLLELFKASLPDTRFKANHALVDAGYERLGVGSWGMVYRKPGSSYVLKVFSSTDKAYLSYLALIKNHSNVHFPKIRGKLVQVTPAYYGVRLEPLEKATSSNISQFIMAVDVYTKGKNISEKELKQDSYFWNNFLHVKEWMKQNPDVQQACDLIMTLTPPYLLDIKPDNIMMRGNTFVFSDPIMGEE